ncbi:hypothetical protein KI387_005470, partial [Taxus chinensis]
MNKSRKGMEEEEEEEGEEEGGGKEMEAWERAYADDRSWEALQEDESGILHLDKKHQQLQQRHYRRRQQSVAASHIQRGLIRYLYIILDFSRAAGEKDFKPNRMVVVANCVEAFVREFFDQNPLSHLGIIIIRNGVAHRLTDLSGSPESHIKALASSLECSGDSSLQNALDLAHGYLNQVPLYGHREVLVLFSALSTCDPGDIMDTIRKCKDAKMRCSVVGLSAEIYICKHLCEETGGLYSVALDESHFKDLLLEHAPPPPAIAEFAVASLVKMGFPQRGAEGVISICACHKEVKIGGGYTCPRCKARVCELPTECHICGLTLVSSPHLARSYHHLFPVTSFEEVLGRTALNQRLPRTCFGCQQFLPNPGELFERLGDLLLKFVGLFMMATITSFIAYHYCTQFISSLTTYLFMVGNTAWGFSTSFDCYVFWSAVMRIVNQQYSVELSSVIGKGKAAFDNRIRANGKLLFGCGMAEPQNEMTVCKRQADESVKSMSLGLHPDPQDCMKSRIHFQVCLSSQCSHCSLRDNVCVKWNDAFYAWNNGIERSYRSRTANKIRFFEYMNMTNRVSSEVHNFILAFTRGLYTNKSDRCQWSLSDERDLQGQWQVCVRSEVFAIFQENYKTKDEDGVSRAFACSFTLCCSHIEMLTSSLNTFHIVNTSSHHGHHEQGGRVLCHPLGMVSRVCSEQLCSNIYGKYSMGKFERVSSLPVSKLLAVKRKARGANDKETFWEDILGRLLEDSSTRARKRVESSEHGQLDQSLVEVITSLRNPRVVDAISVVGGPINCRVAGVEELLRAEDELFREMKEWLGLGDSFCCFDSTFEASCKAY